VISVRASPRGLCVLISVFLGASFAQAAAGGQDRADLFAKLPDWSGIWESDFAALKAADPPNGGSPKGKGSGIIEVIRPPFAAEREAAYQKLLAGPPQPFTDCKGISFPNLMYNPGWIDVLVTPEEVAITHTHHETRHVYINRSHPAKDELWPTRMGHSIGHWEGDTLIVDTVAVRGDLWLIERYPSGETRWTVTSLSDQAHFIERIHMVNHDRLEDRVTVYDEIALQHPWNLTIEYKRLSDVDRMIDEDCVENSRDIILKRNDGASKDETAR
jgi:hypothetical protein